MAIKSITYLFFFNSDSFRVVTPVRGRDPPFWGRDPPRERSKTDKWIMRTEINVKSVKTNVTAPVWGHDPPKQIQMILLIRYWTKKKWFSKQGTSVLRYYDELSRIPIKGCVCAMLGKWRKQNRMTNVSFPWKRDADDSVSGSQVSRSRRYRSRLPTFASTCRWAQHGDR